MVEKVALLLILAVPFLPMQDMDELLEMLESDSPIEREEAMDTLVKMGAKALPALKDVSTDDKDLEARVNDLIHQIETQLKLKKLRGPDFRLTGEWTDKPVKEIVAEWNKTCANMFHPHAKIADAKVTLKLKDAHPWAAAAALSKAHGGVRMGLTVKGIELTPGKPAKNPIEVTGPFAVQLDRITRSTYGEFGGGGNESSTLRISVSYQTNIQPTNIWLSLNEAADDTGKDLIIKNQNYEPTAAPAPGNKVVPMYLTLGQSDEKAKTIKVLKAGIRVQFVLSWKEVAFKDPMNKTGQTLTDEKDRYTLNRCKRQGRYIDVEIRSTKKEATRSFDGRSLFILIDKKGKTYEGSVHSTTWHGSGDISYGMYFSVPNETKIDRLSYRVPKETHTEEMRVEFKGVPLP